MAADVAKTNGSTGVNRTGVASAYSPLREMLGYDPFRNFFPNLDPQIDVVRSQNGFVVEVPVAGFSCDQIEITVKDDVLSINAKNDRRAFTRTLQLPEDIDAGSIEASTEHGMLTLTLTRHPEAQPRRIEIKSKG